MKDQWKTVAREELVDMPPFLRVERHEVELNDGRVLREWGWIETPDYVNVVVMDRDKRFPLFIQTKYALEGESFAPVGGYLEPGEDPLAGAQRELLEEMGMAADDWSHLSTTVVDANRGCGRAHLFLCTGGRVMQARDADDLEHQQLVRLTRGELEAVLDRGEIGVLAWAANVALALRRLDAMAEHAP